MSGATEVSKREKFFHIELKTVSMIFENDTDEGAQYERQWHDDQDKILSSRINEYTPQIKAEIDSIINSDNDKFGIIEYSEEIENVPYDYEKIVANANRPYRNVWMSEDETDDNSGDISSGSLESGDSQLDPFASGDISLSNGFFEKVYLDETDDTSGDDVLFMPEVTGPYRYELRLAGNSDNEYLNDFFTCVTLALKLGISADATKELKIRLSYAIKRDDPEVQNIPI